MNISKYEQRVLHALALGGRIHHRRDDEGRIVAVDCLSRDGWRLADCTPSLFRKLKRRRLIGSTGGSPIASHARGWRRCARSSTNARRARRAAVASPFPGESYD